MFVLDDARIGYFALGIVDDGVSLPVRGVLYLRLEGYRTVLQLAETIIEIFVDRTREHHPVRKSGQFLAVLKVIAAGEHLATLQQAAYQCVISADRDALIFVVEIVVVKRVAHGQTLDDECRQLRALPSPLLLRVAFYQRFVDVLAYQQLRLFFEIARFRDACRRHPLHRFTALLLQLGLCLAGRAHAPHLIERVHVERQIEEPPFVVGDGRVGVAVELYEGVDEVPHLLVRRVEDVCAVFVDVYATHALAIQIAARMRPAVYHEATLALPHGTVCDDRTEQSRTYYQIIISLHPSPRFF